jgi:hypothetical protein
VDLPEPEGPQTTTTSPFWMRVLQSSSTWNAPYHLETFLISIMLAFRSNYGDADHINADPHRYSQPQANVGDINHEP